MGAAIGCGKESTDIYEGIEKIVIRL